MSAGIERRISAVEEWVEAVSENSAQVEEQRSRLLNLGFRSFFAIVDELPGIDEQPSKHWSDYLEEEIDFVVHRPDEGSSATKRALRMRITDALGFVSYTPLRIGVFNVGDDKSEANKSIHGHSASLVVESMHGQIFRRRVVLHLDYKYSDRAPDWYERKISYDLFGIRGDQLGTIQKASEMDLLLAANAAATLFAEEIRQVQRQPLTPSP